MELERIDHVGVAVDDEQQARRVLEDVFGCEPPTEEVVEEQGVRTLIYRLGDAKVELLVPTSEDSPIAKHLDERGEGLHHLAFEVDDVEDAIEHVDASELAMIDDEPREGVEDSEIAFVHPKGTFGTLLELVAFSGGPTG
jgi:methylmalonyl-CoA epimerase